MLPSSSVILRLRAPGCVSLVLTFLGSFAPLEKSFQNAQQNLKEVSKRSLEDLHSGPGRVPCLCRNRVRATSMFDKDPSRVNISRVKFRSRL